MRVVLCAIVLQLMLLGGGCGNGGESLREVAPAVLRWEARNEDGIYGYLIYRSQSREGPFLRINREIVHVVDDDNNEQSSHHYTYTDDDVEPGLTYYYYLDTINQNGRKTRFSGVIAKTVPAD